MNILRLQSEDIEAHERTAKEANDISVTRRRSIMADVSKALYVPKIFTGRSGYSLIWSVRCVAFL